MGIERKENVRQSLKKCDKGITNLQKGVRRRSNKCEELGEYLTDEEKGRVKMGASYAYLKMLLG
jgi:hypothetical protein